MSRAHGTATPRRRNRCFLMNSDFAIRVADSFASQLLTGSLAASRSTSEFDAAHLRCFGAARRANRQIDRAENSCHQMQASPSGNGKRQDPTQLAWTTYCQTLSPAPNFDSSIDVTRSYPHKKPMFISRRQMLHAATCGLGSLALDGHAHRSDAAATSSRSDARNLLAAQDSPTIGRPPTT